MIWLAYSIFAFTFIQFIIALINLFTGTHLPRKGRLTGKKVSVLIPARNEERNIGNILSDLKNSTDNIEVIVFNDHSTDGTADVVRSFAERDNRFMLIDSEGLPAGWLGKNHACDSLARAATGEYLLFLDADVRTGGSLASDAVTYAIDSRSDLVSIFPMQRIITAGEWATVPNMNYILVSLLPLVLVRKSRFPSLAAANGQFMLFRKDTYTKYRPHERMKDNKVEDILIARFFKKNGLVASCLLGDERISCRMYTGFSDAVNGFSKNVAEFFGGSIFLALMFWLITTFGFIPVFSFFAFELFLVYIAIYILTRIAISLSGKQSVLNNILWILPLQLSMGLFIVKSLTIRINKKYVWKGREIS